jgi:pimeloyl-ACP methyl ester carboxylesterase
MQTAAELVPVDATGRRLALTRRGTGAPTVVLETGLGVESAEWEPIQREVATFTATCRYDRANRGASDPAPTPRAAGALVGDLHALLETAAIPRPCVLVGHSLGGVIARVYAHQYPHDVAGLLLVDPMHEDQFARIGPLIPPAFPGEPDTLTQFRRFWTGEWRDPTKNPEGVDFPASREQARAIDSLGDIPMLVLTAGSEFLRAAPPGNPAAARMQELWLEMQREVLQQSSNARQVLVETSGHFMQREQPEVVVAAIRRMVETIHGPAA